MNVSVGQIFSFNVTEGGEFHCVATNHLGNDSSSRICVTTEDSPWSPSINVPSDLKEHQSVTVTCSAFTPCPHSPPELTWNLQQDSLRQTEKNTDGTFTTKIQENITLSDTHDGYNISCSARYPVIGGNKTAETEVTLSVSYAPKHTSASIRPSVGSRVELSCSSRAKPPVNGFTWFKNSSEGAIKLSVGQVHSFNAIEGGEYYCMAMNDLGNQTSPVIHVSVIGLPINPLYWGIIPAGCIVFICLFAGFWYFNSKYRAPKQTQSQISDVQMSATKPEEQLHYGEITFSRKTPETSSRLVQHNEQTVYAEVKLSQRESSSKQTPGNPEDVCCEEKKE
ncbi:B-cell receptor CD22-like [Poecilia latipinna]|uniref:B-cell receptor CD22-like n=1 Tax=Poecilia latipinna TaxID=48699 RepID=UPI00072EA3FD|nr:PREDICTED: B-cell receptor CD22-like [Poecilia latipinna]